MSRHARRCAFLLSLATVCTLAVVARVADAQTIADYSRAQRTLLENAMTQAAARSAGLGASSPAAVASAPSQAPMSPPSVARLPLLPPAPAVQVSGVFASSAGVVAEVMVNATAYLLGAGQGVPGTGWHVEAVSIDRVVLSRRVGEHDGDDAQGARKVFALPALR